MTVREAIDRGILAVRLPEWHAQAQLVLPPVGPWARLYDPIGTGDEGGIPLLITALLQDGCDRYLEVVQP